jgi:SAM-dependent methyltransferase
MSDAVYQTFPPRAPRKLGPETARNDARRRAEGFNARYLSGGHVLDIGYRGGTPDAQPVTEKAIGIDLETPGYDGVRLPFEDGSQDAVFASHTLEHIEDHRPVLAEWFRVLKRGGYLVIAVPHQYLYERKSALPSRFNGDHKRFYTPASLLREVEEALPPGCYRVRSLRDIDDGFDYDMPPERNPVGSYEIELVVQKIKPPFYAARLSPDPAAEKAVAFYAGLVAELAKAATDPAKDGHDMTAWQADTMRVLSDLPIPPFQRLRAALPPGLDMKAVQSVLRRLLETAPFDEGFYLAKYNDISAAVKAGKLKSGKTHYIANGYFHNRMAQPVSPLFD